MKILVVAEGKHERGRHGETNSGALAVLVSRLLGPNNYRLEFGRLHDNQIHAFHGPGRGFFKKALRWLLEAEKRGVAALVFLVDEDDCKERRQAIAEVQVSPNAALPRAMGVAIRTFDAWMLADEQALSNVLGLVVDMVASPEDLRYPKHKCEQLRDTSESGISLTDLYAETAQRLDIERLRQRCPDGFVPFADRVQALGSALWPKK